MNKNYIFGGLGCGCIIIIFIVITALLCLALSVAYLKPTSFNPVVHVKPPSIHMEPPNVHIHPRQSAFKCTNCGAKFYINVRRILPKKCPSCGKFTLIPDDGN